jgi:malate synthase
MVDVDVPAYLSFLPPTLLAALDAVAEPVPDVPGLRVLAGLQREHPALESTEVMSLVVEVYRAVRGELRDVLEARRVDRAFVDEVTRQCREANAGKRVDDPSWATVIGARDASGRVVVGPSGEEVAVAPVSRPTFFPATQRPGEGFEVTLFGPPDSAKLAVNAMNALHRKKAGEPAIVGELVAASGQVPRWGADSEDSKTPMARDLLRATENLAACFDGTLQVDEGSRVYRLAEDGLALPLKRVAGLALPDGNHLLDGQPLPLHLVELVQHVWANRGEPRAHVLYFPKLETEGEATYLAHLFEAVEAAIQRRDPTFAVGSLRVLVVFENPRAIFRIKEIARALGRYFLGGSLGWHDFLASTARLLKEDPGYRIPVKADPNIVIHHIRESHNILVRDLAACGAQKIGGMYGILPTDGDAASYAVAMVGFIKDVVTQMKRGLDGFWVAHPDFVRLGIALVEAWRQRERNGATDHEGDALERLIAALVTDPTELAPLLAFVRGPDVHGLEASDPRYPRAVLAAELGVSDRIANHDPEEVRYNVFQALQYLADWLSGRGCVALPATLKTAQGEPVFVRIMDDLATTERSRWEVWAEIAHGRVSRETFESILDEEAAFIREGHQSPTHRTQVRWEGEGARWYPVAVALLRQLMTTPEPPEFATELLLPFTFDLVRQAADPLAAARALCPGKYT